MTEEMFGGQHQNDEATRAERVGWTQNSESTAEKDPPDERALSRKRTGVTAGENQRLPTGKKDEKTLLTTAGLVREMRLPGHVELFPESS